jgi:hypothetical protein
MAPFKDGPAQERVVAIAHTTAVGIIVALAAKEPASGTSTVRAHKSRWVEMPLQPQQAEAIIKEVGNRKVDHTLLLQAQARVKREYSMCAQLLDMVSFSFLDVQFDPYLPSEAQKLWLRNAFRNDQQTLPCYHMCTPPERRTGAYASAIRDEHPTPLRSVELMPVLGETMQPEFVGLWLCKLESGLKRTNAET